MNIGKDRRTGTETEGEREKKETKTEFQTGNLSNPQSCENNWGGKEGKDGEQGVRKKANFKLI